MSWKNCLLQVSAWQKKGRNLIFIATKNADTAKSGYLHLL